MSVGAFAIGEKDRFLSKVVAGANGCWEWAGGTFPNRYGRLRIGDRSHLAHRVSYELFIGPIPDGLQIDHLCRNRRCVRPDHLEPVTCRENLLRGDTIIARNAAKTHCPHGHEYTEENTYRDRGDRRCRECHLKSDRARRSRAHNLTGSEP